MKPSIPNRIQLAGRVVDYRVVRSRVARKLRVRVGAEGIEVVLPHSRSGEVVPHFLVNNERWIIEQLKRVDGLRDLRRTVGRAAGELLFRGKCIQVRIE